MYDNLKSFGSEIKDAPKIKDRSFIFGDLFKNDFIGNSNISSIVNYGSTTVTAVKVSTTSVIATTSSTTTQVKSSKVEEVGITIDGVIEYTNIARKKAGLQPLKKNKKLNSSAKIKADDMLKKQYFDHDSPTGVTASDLAKSVNYDFKLVGENLALGDFVTSKKLVDAWMNSKAHKANILNPKFTEIGIGIVEGDYKGQITFLAVQHFAKPLPVCEVVDDAARKHIDNEKAELSIVENDLRKIAETIEANPNQSQNFIDEYNTRVGYYNDSLARLKVQIESFNKMVSDYNTCIEK